MKIVKILLLIAVILFSVPLDSIAGHHEDMCPTHQCVLVCHSCCHSVIPSRIEMPAAPIPSLIVFPIADLSHEDPFLEGFKRPPVVTL